MTTSQSPYEPSRHWEWLKAPQTPVILSVVGTGLTILTIMTGQIESIRGQIESIRGQMESIREAITTSDAQRQADTRAINARIDGAHNRIDGISDHGDTTP